MDERDRKKIQRHIYALKKLVNVEQLEEYLIGKGVISHEFVDRIKARYPYREDYNMEFFLNYSKRGPSAFSLLIEALNCTGHVEEAKLLSQEESPQFSRPRRISQSSLESPESESLSSGESQSHSLMSISGEGSSSSASGNGSSEATRGSGAHSPSQIMRNLNINGSHVQGVPNTVFSEVMMPEDVPIKKAELYNNGITDPNLAYPMMSNPRGYALIINNIEFPNDKNSSRKGAEFDSENLTKLLEELYFKVTVHHNATQSDITHPSNGILKKFIDQFSTHPPVDAAIVAIMSHGLENKIRTSDPGETYITLFEDVIEKFNNVHCPVLREKPKIFILQACRGECRDRGVRRTQIDGRKLTQATTYVNQVGWGLGKDPLDYDSWGPEPELLPSFEDILICYSTVPGYVANRDIERGTWYIKVLCDAVRKYAHDSSIEEILKKVGLKLREINSEIGEKQMSSYKNMGFHRNLYFNPGLVGSPHM